LLSELEEILITADVGVDATLEIVQTLKARAAARGVQDSAEVMELLKEILKERLRPAEGALNLRIDDQPTVFLILGVNGSGKTTTIAKLAQHLKDDFGKRTIIFAAGTRFARRPLSNWGFGRSASGRSWWRTIRGQIPQPWRSMRWSAR
jgi:fused signal recognition particle receptor